MEISNNFQKSNSMPLKGVAKRPTWESKATPIVSGKNHSGIKTIQEDHFPILWSKLDGFSDELGLLEAFVAGLIASYDYSIISMIFRKIIEKKIQAEKLEMSLTQKGKIYYELFSEMTKSYKVDQNFSCKYCKKSQNGDLKSSVSEMAEEPDKKVSYLADFTYYTYNLYNWV